MNLGGQIQKERRHEIAFHLASRVSNVFPLLPPSFEGLGSWLEHAMVHTMVHGKYRGIGFPCSIVRVPIETESVSAPQILDRPRYLCTMVSIVYKYDT